MRFLAKKRVANLYDCHVHTPFCGHAVGPMEDYATRGAMRGLRGVVFTCHSPFPLHPEPRIRMAEADLPLYIDQVAAIKESFAGRLEVLLGLECDYIPGVEDWLEKLRKQADFSLLLGSVHSQLSYYRERFKSGPVLESQRIYFQHLAQAAETGFFQILAHPDRIKYQSGGQWLLSGVMDDLLRCLDRIAASGVAMELNTAQPFGPLREFSPGPKILREIRKRGIPVTLGSDAHQAVRVGDRFEQALRELEKCGFTEVWIPGKSKLESVSISTASASLVADSVFGFIRRRRPSLPS